MEYSEVDNYRDFLYVEDVRDFHIVSFDVFDTVLKRKIGKPKSIFKLQGRTFLIFRISAEWFARIIGKILGKEEISIDDIYRWLPHYDVTKELLNEFEESVCDENLFDIIQELKSQRKEILFVSDMYLPAEFIKRLLEKNLITPPYRLYVSSEVGTTKSLGLFQHILSETGYNPSQMLHIGDNYQSDFLAPRRYGISSIYWSKWQ
jgi:HAD superfamily hydrolase (TIGR01549 family)